MMDEFDTAAEEARQQRATIRAQCDELIRLRHEHATMLATLTATQKRCTEQEQKIRDQERELVELRGKQGAPVEVSPGPFIQGWLSDVDQHDTEEQALAAAKDRARRHGAGEKSFVAQVSRTLQLIPARAERMEEVDFTGEECDSLRDACRWPTTEADAHECAVMYLEDHLSWCGDARVIRIVRARPSEASATLETARRRLAAVAESMTEHAYQEMASALEVDACRVGPSEPSAVEVLRELVAWWEAGPPTTIGRRLPECDGSRAGCLGSTGGPGVRDTNAPCDMFSPGKPTNGGCQGDGHYLCRECGLFDARGEG